MDSQEIASPPTVAAGAPRVFVSYAWEDDDYRVWVRRLAVRLRQDGTDVRLDAWHCRDRTIPEFMNSEARAADKVLILCSPKYREKVHAMEDGERMTGSGWEAMLVGATLFAGWIERAKIVVALTRGQWNASAPDFLVGLPYFDLAFEERFEAQYLELLRALHGAQEKAPQLGTPPPDLEPAPLAPLTGPAGARAAPPLSPALVAYRQSLLRELSQRYQIDTRFVRLRLLDMVHSEHALQFKEQAEDYTDLRDVLAAIPERAMVLLGAPGCGKSTLLRRLQLDDARDRLADHGERVSLFVSLGAYSLHKDPARDAPQPLDWLNAQWRRQAPDLSDFEALLGQHRVLLLLDALNEMPHRDGDDFRERVEKWRCFLRDDFPPGNQAIFSCRSLDYSETLSVKDDVDVRQVRVQPLTPEQIKDFLDLYAAEHAEGAWAEIRDNKRLLELYSTPYFLKLLTDQLDYDPRVANERAALFTGFVRRALEREIAGRNPLFVQDRVLDARDRERIAQRTWANAFDLPRRGPLIPRLQLLAYTMQERFGASDGKQVLITLDEALAALDHPLAEDLLKAGDQLGVLDEERKTDQVRFFHQLLQEYFAARQLRQQPAEAAGLTHSEWHADRIKPSLANKLATLQDFEPLPPPDPTGWEETAVLAASMAVDPDAFVMGLVEANLALAGRCAAALSATDRPGPDTVAELQRRLLARSRDPEADLRARIAASRALGELGDPRFERRRGPHGDYLLPPLVMIEAGTYPIGSDEGLYKAEAPAHEVSLAAFAIAKFSVTNAEWRCFMEAGGYEDERWWDTEAARRWRRGEGTAEGPKQQLREIRQWVRDNLTAFRQLLKDGKMTCKEAEDWENYRMMSDSEFDALLEDWYPPGRQTDPAFWNDPVFNHPAQPTVGICWHEARAYCAWLSAQTGRPYRLPSEASGKPPRAAEKDVRIRGPASSTRRAATPSRPMCAAPRPSACSPVAIRPRALPT